MQRAFDLIKQRLEEERHPEICGGWENLRIDRAIEIVNQVATEYFKENYFNLDNTKLHDCPKCGEKATHRVNKKGSWACGCFKCGLFKSSYDHAKAIQAWEDYCGEYGGGWIPVSSGKLPKVPEGKDYVDVLITKQYTSSAEVIFTEYYDEDGFNDYEKSLITAWRYDNTPEPYKAESEE